MALDQEQFERLEAYLDGELDPTARAEVDAQLNANPQLRKLMNELAKSRDLLRGLPRAKAPPELLESFQSQLERAELFGDRGAQEADVVARISRAPQYMALAAVVLLALGLTMIIYKVMLPHKQPNTVAIATNPTMEATPEESPRPKASPPTEPAPLMAEAAHKASVAAPQSVAPTVPVAATPTTLDRNMVTKQEVDDLKNRLAVASQPAFDVTNGGPIVMVVRSQSPRAADEQVRGYLGANGIAYVEDQAVPGGAMKEQGFAANIDNSATRRTVDATPLLTERQEKSFGSSAGGGQITAQQQATEVGSFAKNIAAASQNSSAAIFGQNNSFANSNQGYAMQAGNTYRAKLTQRQLQDLNSKLQTRGDQWTEFHSGSSFGTEKGLELQHQMRALATTQLTSIIPTTRPATAPTTQLTVAPLAVATQPSASTQPATTAPAEQPRDVVIVVHNEPIEVPSTAPAQATTAPTTAP